MKEISTSRWWLFSFLFLTVVGLTIQLVVIPYVAPSLNGGDGLVVNTDSVTFHGAAVRLARTINEEGWRNWQLRPEAWGHVGVSSALYALTIPKPWVLVPVAAALMAGSIVLLMSILRLAGVTPRVAMLAALPLLFLPSTAMLTAQWHKDQIAIPSTFAMILGFLLLLRGTRLLTGLLSIAAGTFGLWLVRDHIIQVMVGASLMGIACAAITARRVRAAHMSGLARMCAAAIMLAVVSHQMPSWTQQLAVTDAQWQDWSAASVRERELAAAAEIRAATAHTTLTVAPPPSTSMRPVPDPVRPEVVETRPASGNPGGWKPNPWIPAALDQRMASFAQVRDASRRGTGHGCSSVDTDVEFTSAEGLVRYVPRAAAIVLLAPFPRTWLTPACSGGGRMLPLLFAVEMAFAYCAFAGIPLVLWQLRRQPSAWYLFFLCVTALLVHGFIFVNVGTLFRTRYAWFGILIALGTAGVANLWLALGKRSHSQVEKDCTSQRDGGNLICPYPCTRCSGRPCSR